MVFVAYSSDRKYDDPAVTVDKMGRLVLNAALRRKLNCKDREIELYVFFNAETKQIGLSFQPEKKKDKPFKFDKSRGYTYAQDFLKDVDIPYEEGATRFIYKQTVQNGIMAFSACKEYKSKGITFKTDQNGHLTIEDE